MRLAKAWYASQDRATSLWKFLVYDDVGELFFGDGVLGFAGREYDFDIDDIRSVSVTPVRVGWGLMIPSLLASVLLAPCMPLPCYALVLSKDLTARVIGWTFIGLVIGGWYLYLAIYLPYLWRTPWVRIEHGTHSGDVTYSYFAICTELGRSVRRLETQQLAEQLRADLEAGRTARPAQGPKLLPNSPGPAEEGIREL
jgi:hypothetical protein